MCPSQICPCSLQVDWKLTRGKWRPKLLDYAKAHSEDAVRDATSTAFESMREAEGSELGLKEGMSALTELKVYLRHHVCCQGCCT